MKVNTDGVLLGCFSTCSGTGHILEIGTGSGYIALMMAQKTIGPILAIDIDAPSCRQAHENFMNSPWSERLSAQCISIQELSEQGSEQFDLIVSNPPFHTEGIKSQDSRKRKARHADDLSFEDLIRFSANLLKNGGRFEVIIPFAVLSEFSDIASEYALFTDRQTRVIPVEGKECNRVMISFTKNVRNLPETDFLVIRDTNHRYTEAYRAYVNAFYLDFPY